ncbi:Phosphatidylglycerophosphatase A [BD1-7 clade bacterium]|uniref:Phosphatidylglycerophosphatase A n=1 Tax=BD1-7 clade bacterium TaxID=2029982 RepID=A0A5S9MZL9_9GAMM|nr:Phosphatidylglycerophosphatase A [BD1-7 clade bacterium]CAA0082735.1 Phosphatidylglycerophosphatase A [BD1-7 clade bacterium]
MAQFDLKNPIHLLATGFGSGLSRWMPGTVGTIAAIPLYYLLAMLPPLGYQIVVAIAAVAGIALCGRCASDIGVPDHGSIVWDEFVGLWITLALVQQLPGAHWLWVVIGFAWFRLFDIVKPFPIGLLDKRLHGGLGIMLDDILAGFFAMLALKLSMWWYLTYHLGLG